jgi:hypothetical protein
MMNLACCFGICSAYLVFVASTLATILPMVRACAPHKLLA